MRKSNYFQTFLFAVVTLIVVGSTQAQESRSTEALPPPEQHQAVDQMRGDRGNLLRQLGLLDEQVQHIRKVQAEKRPLMRDALKRLHETTRALDDAIYADQLNEADIDLRMKEAELAQAELARLRYMNELAVRRILTPDQLIRFRELRQRFEKMRHGLEKIRRYKIDRQRPGKESDSTPDGQPQQRVVRPKAVI